MRISVFLFCSRGNEVGCVGGLISSGRAIFGNRCLVYGTNSWLGVRGGRIGLLLLLDVCSCRFTSSICIDLNESAPNQLKDSQTNNKKERSFTTPEQPHEPKDEPPYTSP